VRNRTDEALSDLEITGTARDKTGKLIASGSSQGVAPSVMEPGEWSFGYVYFGLNDLPIDATFDLTATASKAGGEFMSDVDLVVKEVSQTAGDYGQQLVGILASESSAEIKGPISVLAICFDGGKPVSTVSGYTDGDSVAPNGTISFSLDLFDRRCPAFALGASGYDY
jgi:hypothetical protein